MTTLITQIRNRIFDALLAFALKASADRILKHHKPAIFARIDRRLAILGPTAPPEIVQGVFEEAAELFTQQPATPRTVSELIRDYSPVAAAAARLFK